MKRTFRALDVREACMRKAKAEFYTTKEANGWIRNSFGEKAARVTIPKGRSELKAGTLGSVIRQLKLSTKQFHRFMDCSMKSNEYFEILDSSRSE